MAKKKTANSKATEVVEPTPAPPPPLVEDLPPPPPIVEEAPAKSKKKKTETCYEFIKNFKTGEKIDLGEGETFVFPSNPYHTSDKALAEKLRKVSEKYCIIENAATEV